MKLCTWFLYHLTVKALMHFHTSYRKSLDAKHCMTWNVEYLHLVTSPSKKGDSPLRHFLTSYSKSLDAKHYMT